MSSGDDFAIILASMKHLMKTTDENIRSFSSSFSSSLNIENKRNSAFFRFLKIEIERILAEKEEQIKLSEAEHQKQMAVKERHIQSLEADNDSLGIDNDRLRKDNLRVSSHYRPPCTRGRL